MKWLDAARARLRLVFARGAAESRMNKEFRLHIELETEHLIRAKGLAPDEARCQAIVVAAVVALVALMACSIPAARAVRIDPTTAMRTE